MRFLRRALVAVAMTALPVVLLTAKPAAADVCVQYGVSTDGTEPAMQTVYCDTDVDLIATRHYDHRTRVGPIIVRAYFAHPFPT